MQGYCIDFELETSFSIGDEELERTCENLANGCVIVNDNGTIQVVVYVNGIVTVDISTPNVVVGSLSNSVINENMTLREFLEKLKGVGVNVG